MNQLTASAVRTAMAERGVEVSDVQAQHIIDARGAIMMVSDMVGQTLGLAPFLTEISHAAPGPVAAAWASTFGLSNGSGLVPPAGLTLSDYLQVCQDAIDAVHGPYDPVADFNGLIAGSATRIWQGQQVASTVEVPADALGVLEATADGMESLATGLSAATGSGWSDSLHDGARSIRSVQVDQDDLVSFVAMVAPRLDQATAQLTSLQQAALTMTEVPADNDALLAAACQSLLDVVTAVIDLPSHRLMQPGE